MQGVIEAKITILGSPKRLLASQHTSHSKSKYHSTTCDASELGGWGFVTARLNSFKVNLSYY
jgi:hypothetical protein